MALYYFHLVDGRDVLLDPEGRELAGIDAVAKAAMREVRDILCGEVRAGHLRLDQSIVVQDGSGASIHRLPFTDALKITWPPGHPRSLR
jgi:hypothetical protein